MRLTETMWDIPPLFPRVKGCGLLSRIIENRPLRKSRKMNAKLRKRYSRLLKVWGVSSAVEVCVPQEIYIR